MFVIENFIKGLKRILKDFSVEENDEYFVITKAGIAVPDEKEWKIDKESLAECAAWFSDETVFTGNGLYSKIVYEIAVKLPERGRGMPYRLYDRELYRVTEKNYDMGISKASKEYVFALMCYVGKIEKADIDPDFLFLNRGFRVYDIKNYENFVEAAHLLTAKIIAPEERSQHDLHKMINSYLFNVAYNKDVVFSINDFKNTIKRKKSFRREGQLFPYKAYNGNLTNYYYQGLSTDIPFTQYLAFYHVAEYFFQTIAEQDAFQEIENCITSPSFSPYRETDVRDFYNKIKKRMKEQKDDGLWDEKVGLLLCLKEYVPDLDRLKNIINTIDPTALNYYKTEKIPFSSKGATINFDDREDMVYANIRTRVYAVRNAIVHSKEGDNLRYEPFKHDKDLIKELPLIRVIAEEIIVNSAKRLEFI